jgi:hypothetical protein
MPTNDADVVYGFTHEPTAPRGARRAIEPIAGEGEFAEDVKLAASEMVSNVVLHTDNGGTLRAWNADPLRVEVHDTSPVLPTPKPEQTQGGRGLGIISHISSRWGAEPSATGKIVWAEFRRPPSKPTPA